MKHLLSKPKIAKHLFPIELSVLFGQANLANTCLFSTYLQGIQMLTGMTVFRKVSASFNTKQKTVLLQWEKYSNNNLGISLQYQLHKLIRSAMKWIGVVDATQSGFYGGAFPWKVGYLPFNPHFLFQQNTHTTDSIGNLHINIKVAAQDQ
ncbi:MAG: hypothetical protein Q8J88_00290 [Bacteroidales bacterium]|nr:hypothetical protein [Bacteroidales bacterium]